jgi:peptidoglycan/xylan/chitin deacetylase (PgdA/CDA1 family)
VLFTMIHQSDLVQRISRRREHKTQIENRFKGWHDMLLNGLLQIAVEWGVRTIRSPAASLAQAHTDRKRVVQPELFDRLYDRDLQRCLHARREGEWWVVDVAANAARALLGAVGTEAAETDKIICLIHDVERGLGHVGIDDAFAARANQEADGALNAMLAVERQAGVRATYNVVGCLLGETRDRITAGGHCLAFHSFDHPVAKPGASEPLPARTEGEQLRACRRIDYRLKGYRAPRSVITPELANDALCYWNFEWLASSARSFGFAEPRLEERVAKLPVHLDDFRLYRGEVEYEAWEAGVVKKIAAHPVAIIGLHDCYGPFWLPRYPGLLDRVRQLGTLRTLDQVAATLWFRHAV